MVRKASRELFDAAGFSDDIKRFEGFGLQALIVFSGSYDFSWAIMGLSFQRIAAKRRFQAMPLPDVPPVLFSEACGVDAGWREKGLF